jgi:hypothetical protein
VGWCGQERPSEAPVEVQVMEAQECQTARSQGRKTARRGKAARSSRLNAACASGTRRCTEALYNDSSNALPYLARDRMSAKLARGLEAEWRRLTKSWSRSTDNQASVNWQY